MTSSADTARAALPPEGRAALRGGVLGNYVDQLHIFLPLVALAPALPHLAGPGVAAQTGAVVVMAMLLGRPLGGMIFGRIADRVGRTRTTRIAIGGTAACTLGIAAMPTHEVLGWGTIALILALRFLGGIFVAGEYSAAIPLAMEWSRPRRRGLASGLIMSMAPWAQASIALATAGLLAMLGPGDYARWGWRLAFAVGGLASLGMLAYYSRHVADSPAFHRAHTGEAVAGSATRPVAETQPGLATPPVPESAPAPKPRLAELLVGRYAGLFWQLFGLMTGLWFLTNMVVMVLTGRMRTDVGLDAEAASLAMAYAAIGQAIVMAIAGHVSTFTGRKTFFIGYGVLAAVAAPLLWLWTMHQDSLAPAAVGAIALQVTTVAAYGPVGAYLSERFPTAIRSTGYGTAYSLSIIVPALYPYYLPALESALGHNGAVIALIVLGGALVAACGALAPRSMQLVDEDEGTA